MNKKFFAAALAAALALTATSALAYTPYIAASDFWPTQGAVFIQGASTQNFYNPGVGLPGDLHLAGPTGAEPSVASTEVNADMTRVGLNFDKPGTYRVSTPEMLGQVTQVWDFGNNTAGDPVVRPRAASDPTPDGATMASYQSVQVANTYFTYGAPSRTAVDQNSDHLVIHPITDPNQITQAGGFQVEILFDGAAAPNFSVVIYGAGDPDTNLTHFVNTDTSGRATLTFSQPGHYTAAVRKLARTPAGSAVALQAFTTTLTFDVMAAAHAPVPVATPHTPTQQSAHRRLHQLD